MLKKINTSTTIDPVREMHYGFHHRINPSIFPHVHDFYELALVTEGAMKLEVNNKSNRIEAGTLTLLRPGDVHSRSELSGMGSYVNLAFPEIVIIELFQYLDIPDMPSFIMKLPEPPQVILSLNETALLKMRLEKLNLYPIDMPHIACQEMRHLVLDIIHQYFIPIFSQNQELNCPYWLSELLKKLDTPDYFSASLEELAKESGCTKEHLCRGFRKYLGVSPKNYINAKRLNYAANQLLHSDQKVIDIAYSSGFQSLSRFYHAFKNEFQMSALEYRQIHLNSQNEHASI